MWELVGVTESGEIPGAAAALCLAEIAAELGCSVERLPGRIVRAVLTYGGERSAAATTRPAPAHEDAGRYAMHELDEITRVDWLRRRRRR